MRWQFISTTDERLDFRIKILSAMDGALGASCQISEKIKYLKFGTPPL